VLFHDAAVAPALHGYLVHLGGLRGVFERKFKGPFHGRRLGGLVHLHSLDVGFVPSGHVVHEAFFVGPVDCLAYAGLALAFAHYYVVGVQFFKGPKDVAGLNLRYLVLKFFLNGIHG
jgi:hypothetical protein